MRQPRIPPSVRRILQMSYPVLLEHNALIELKLSKLSSKQRKQLQVRLKHLVSKAVITQSEVELSVIKLEDLLYNGK